MKRKLRRPKLLFFFSGIALLGIIFIIIFNDFSEADRFELEEQPYLGEATATVEIVEFGDYKCPSCKAFNDTLFPQIQEELIATGKVKFYYIHYPFMNEDSKRAARFSEAVHQVLGNDVFWQFHHVMFDKQPPEAEKQDIYTEAFLTETLNGLVSEEKTEQVLEAFNNGTGKNAVEEDLSYANEMNVDSTPVLLVNGERFEGSNIEDLTKMVEEVSNQ